MLAAVAVAAKIDAAAAMVVVGVVGAKIWNEPIVEQLTATN